MTPRSRSRHEIRGAVLAISLVTLVTAGVLAATGRDEPATPRQAALSADATPVAYSPPSDRARKVWTQAELRSAAPFPLPEVAATGARSATVPSGAPGAIPGQRADGSTPPGTGAESPEDTVATRAVDPRSYDYPAPYTAYKIPRKEVRKWPRATVGVFFFTRDGSGWRCSAASVGNFAVLTAGHCVHDGMSDPYVGEGWSEDAVFIPAYDDSRPCPGLGCKFGIWTANHLWVAGGWAPFEDYGRDTGGAVLDRLDGRKISQVVGSLGFAWDWPTTSPSSHWNLLGYPAQNPYNGRRMITCQASYAYSILPGTIAVGCDMTGGSSGGPWVRDFGTGNYINGVNSFGRIGLDEMGSPYFDETTWCLYDALTRSRPGEAAAPAC